MNQYQIFKENLWHRLFFRAAIAHQRMDVIRYAGLLSKSQSFLQDITACDSLLGLLAIHKDLWSEGFQNRALAPDEYGMFRTKAIPTMTAEEVFLGDICGLWTFCISDWEDHKGSDSYRIVLTQYQRHLECNINSIVAYARGYLDEYYKINPKIRKS